MASIMHKVMQGNTCTACVAGLVCVSDMVDMIYFCNECRRIIIQLNMWSPLDEEEGVGPAEIHLDIVYPHVTDARKHCSRHPKLRTSQNQYMRCQECICEGEGRQPC